MPHQTEIDRILDELAREHDGDPWHGSPLLQILEGVMATDAAARPIAGGHSIWELVLHMTGWKNEVRRRLSGAPAAEPEGGDWPAIGQPSETRWREAREQLQRAHDDLLSAIRALPEEKLYTPTNDLRSGPLGSGVSYYVLLHGIVQHDVYHSGQIAILKKGSTGFR
jgi:uncharacterized damage-inducible protein DinB